MKLHQGRGSLEKKIGELKHQINLNHLLMGPFNSKCLYFNSRTVSLQPVAIIKTCWTAGKITQQDIKNITLSVTKTCRQISITGKIYDTTNSHPIKKHRSI